MNGNDEVKFLISEEWGNQGLVEFTRKRHQSSRYMKPELRFRAVGLHPEALYKASLTMERVDKCFYKREDGEWQRKKTHEKINQEPQEIQHTDGLQQGSHWMQKGINFSWVKFILLRKRPTHPQSMSVRNNYIYQFKLNFSGFVVSDPKMRFISLDIKDNEPHKDYQPADKTAFLVVPHVNVGPAPVPTHDVANIQVPENHYRGVVLPEQPEFVFNANGFQNLPEHPEVAFNQYFQNLSMQAAQFHLPNFNPVIFPNDPVFNYQNPMFNTAAGMPNPFSPSWNPFYPAGPPMDPLYNVGYQTNYTYDAHGNPNGLWHNGVFYPPGNQF